jgi:hypothetical protein
MYWDVVEVKAEPGYSLFVRFKDGSTGHVQLGREELTIDSGAVAWPGEIDLAPDAMYAAIAARQSAALQDTDPRIDSAEGEAG